MARLKDKVVLITGAAGAIGEAVAEAVGKAGGTVATSDLAGQGAAHALDVTSEPDWLAVMADVGRTYGRLDGLVNAAGIAALGNIEETDFATWRKVLAVMFAPAVASVLPDEIEIPVVAIDRDIEKDRCVADRVMAIGRDGAEGMDLLYQLFLAEGLALVGRPYEFDLHLPAEIDVREKIVDVSVGLHHDEIVDGLRVGAGIEDHLRRLPTFAAVRRPRQ